MSDLESVSRQYQDPSNLQTRNSLHARFQTNRYGWGRWLFDHLDFQPDCRVLDVGCGDGGWWSGNRARIAAGWHLTLLDMSAGMIDAAKAKLAGLNQDLTFAVANVESLPFENGSFDAVIANHMLYHVGDLDRGLREIRRVLRPGGRLYASTNGDGMQELRELVRPLAPDLPFVRNDNGKAFGLENGAVSLGRHFTDVEVHRFEDSLEVTETEPLLAYVLSVRGAKETLSAAAMVELRRQIDERIASAGTFHVTKSQGMFTATRKEGVL